MILVLPMVDGAHYIVGVVNDAYDGTIANDHEVVLWNADNGINDNVTDIIGPNGNSGANNTYMIDCELLNDPCRPSQSMTIRVYNNGDDYVTYNVTVKVTGKGFDEADNLTLNSPPNFTNVTVDDALTTPANEIDLIAASTRSVVCEGVVEDLDGENLTNARAEFYNASSFYGDSDDNNSHYTNSSCFINSSYGSVNQSQIFCNFDVQYYATVGQWECILLVDDNLSISGNDTDTSNINSLLSIGLPDVADYGLVNINEVSDEIVLNVTNYGNVEVNLSLSGYAISEGDGLAMNCTLGSTKNISIEHEKYNLTDSNSSQLTLQQTSGIYNNLTSSEVVRDFGLSPRENDTVNDAINESYWRIYVPVEVGGSCKGNIVFGARQQIGS